MGSRLSINKNNWSMWRIVLTALNLLAIVLCIFFSWHYFEDGAMPGCGTGSSCDQVLSSRWSSLAGIVPVSGLALGAYLAIFIAALNLGSSVELSLRHLSWSVMIILSGTITGSAIWFTILQKWIIESFCIYCMTTHICGVLLSALIIWRSAKERENSSSSEPLLKPARIVVLILAGLLISVLMAIVQFKSTPSVVVEQSDELNLQSVIDYREAPIIGSPGAPYKVTLLFDYQCSHCQKIHFMLNSAVRKYEGKLAFVLNPAPMENTCNPYVPVSKTTFKNSCELAMLSLAVWRAKPEVFKTFENWMFTYDSGNSWLPRSPEAVKTKVLELIGKEKLNSALADPWIEQYLQNGVRLFGQTLQNGRGAIPKMIYNNTWVIPEPYNADDLVTILQKSLGVPEQ